MKREEWTGTGPNYNTAKHNAEQGLVRYLERYGLVSRGGVKYSDNDGADGLWEVTVSVKTEAKR